MIESLLRLLSSITPAANWVVLFASAVIGLFAIYVGIMLGAILTARDPETAEIRYRILCELLKLFRWRRR
jgi:hypothetical protein